MYRLIVFLLAVGLVAACSKGNEEQTEQTAQQTTEQKLPPGHPAIPEEGFSEFEEIIGAHIVPYFNAEGTDTVAEVAPGDYLDLYIFAEFNENYRMAAAEYRLDLPPGLTIMSSAQSDSVILTFGSPDVDFMLAFHCLQGPQAFMMKYTCKTSEDFVGGDIDVLMGSNLEFLGFTLCDATHTMIKARGGKATLRRKQT